MYTRRAAQETKRQATAKKIAKRNRDTEKRRELRQARSQKAAIQTLLIFGAVVLIVGVIVYLRW